MSLGELVLHRFDLPACTTQAPATCSKFSKCCTFARKAWSEKRRPTKSPRKRKTHRPVKALRRAKRTIQSQRFVGGLFCCKVWQTTTLFSLPTVRRCLDLTADIKTDYGLL